MPIDSRWRFPSQCVCHGLARFLSVLLLSLCSIASGNNSYASPLAAVEKQKAIETKVLNILSSDAMQKQIAASEATWQKSPLARTRDGQRTLREGVMNLAGTVAFIAAVGDPYHPQFTWWLAAPRHWMGQRLPGSRWAVDNVDNYYSIAYIDDVSSYKIQLSPTGPEAEQISITLYDNFVGEGNTKLDETLGTYILDENTVRAADGSFTVTLDPQPANGRSNHLQNTPRSRQLLVRQTLGDWSRKSPMTVSIERVGGPPAEKPATIAELTDLAVYLLAGGTDTVLNFEKRFAIFPENSFDKLNIRAREGKDDEMLVPAAGNADGPRMVSSDQVWGFVTTGRFNVAEDEALLVTVNPMDMKFFNFMLTTPWMVSLEHVHASGSFNNHQAEPGADGNYTFVVAQRDPGVHNWLNTGGLRHGTMVIRWQDLTRPVAVAIDQAIPKVELVKLRDVKQKLGSTARFVSPAERRQILDWRASSYMRRCMGEPCEVGNHLDFTAWD